MANRERILLGLTDQERARFDAKVLHLRGSCWPWIGATIQSDRGDVGTGYGCLTIRKQSFRAHRVAYVLMTGAMIPAGMDICHSCDYRRCCNPAHLTAKPRQQNVADMMSRGRHHTQGFVYVEPPPPEVPAEVRMEGLRNLLVANFWANTSKGGDDECWPWLRHCNPKGYGTVCLKCKELGLRKDYLAHRLSYEIHSHPPGDLVVRHTCDNPPCVNPAHLLLGTQADNLADMRKRGRAAITIGELNGHVTLDEASVMRIRRDVPAGVPRKMLASEYGVHVQTIHDIVSRKSWKHI